MISLYQTITEKIRVDLGSRSYNIYIGPGLLDIAGILIASVLHQEKVFIVSDTHVAPLYLERLCLSLAQENIVTESVILPEGEKTKCLSYLVYLLDILLATHSERQTAVIALGGGVIGDLTGFASAVLLRGVRFVQIPTTLLAQVDSSVGGKTGVDTLHGKNLIGAFYQPSLVICDTVTLNTLPLRELKAGYAEIVKYGCIQAPEFFDWLENNGARLLAGDIAACHYAIQMSCTIKAAIIEEDELEDNRRSLLNFGHTFAHALEVEAGFGQTLRHGEAVAVGMVLAFNLSVKLGACLPSDAQRLQHHLQVVCLPTTISAVLPYQPTPERLLSHILHDKKNNKGRITFVLAHRIGYAFLDRTVETDYILRFLKDSLNY